MNRFLIFMLLAAQVAFAGCESDKSASPVANVNEQLDLYLPESAVAGAAGREVTVPVVVQVTDDGGVAPGITVRFRVLNGFGEMTLPTVQTDADGLAASELRATLTRGAQKTIIGVYTDKCSAQGEIMLKGTGLPHSITIGTPPDSLVAPVGALATVNLRAQIADVDGFGVADVPIRYTLNWSNGQATGFVSGDSVSRADGSIQFAYNVFCTGAREEIIVMTDTTNWKGVVIADTVAVQVKTPLSRISSLTLTASPSILDLGVDQPGYSTLRAQVYDVNRTGIPNLKVEFATSFGVLSEITPTDLTGMATARFFNNFESGIDTVRAWIPGTLFTATALIRIQTRSELTGTLRVTSDRDFIYADEYLPRATLRATLKNQDDQAMVDKTITFHAAFGSVTPSVQTDSLGIAEAYFTAHGVPPLDENGNIVPVVIYAKYRPLNLIDSVEVTIRPKNPVASITLYATKQQLQAGSGDSSSLRATCFLLSGAFAPWGTIVRFEVADGNGFFTEAAVPVQRYGVAETYYVAGNHVGYAILHASVWNEGGGADSVVSSNEVQINLLAGPSSRIRVTADPNILNIDDPNAYSTITATVTDEAGNPVRQGELVRFSTDKGNIDGPSVITDTLGHAQAHLRPGDETGVAIVTVSSGNHGVSGNVTVTFEAGYPNSLEVHPGDPLQIGVPGTGGISSASVAVWVKDAHGNLVTRPTPVFCRVLNAPDPPAGPIVVNDSVRTANGITLFQIEAGEQVGGIILRFFSFRDPEWAPPGNDGLFRTDTISVNFLGFSVVAGPPFQLDIDVNANGEDAGGGTWQLQVSARVWDVHRNPVADRIPVVFTVDPQIATIDPGFTGNDIGDGATPGIAFSYLRYHSVNTFDPITISAEVQAPDGLITGERAWTLPLQRGQIELLADPGNVMFDRARPNDTCLVRVWAIVTDGHGVTINNAPVLLTCDRGRFYWRNLRLNGRYIPFFPDPARLYTGRHDQEHNEERGVATVYLRGVMNDFFLDDFALETTTRIEARVEGADGVEAEPVNVRMTRH